MIPLVCSENEVGHGSVEGVEEGIQGHRRYARRCGDGLESGRARIGRVRRHHIRSMTFCADVLRQSASLLQIAEFLRPSGAASYALAATWVPPGRNPATRRYHWALSCLDQTRRCPWDGVRRQADGRLALKQSNVSKSALAWLGLLASIATPQIGQCRMGCGREAIASQPRAAGGSG